ncbi:hypothetical protein [Streptomyces europaeiscabiei]|nr:hypothetical protein [Streptomyces europaeiscabiei]MDX3586068.1 hypothetical protein [Streptomyces europaeiscabiei]
MKKDIHHSLAKATPAKATPAKAALVMTGAGARPFPTRPLSPNP